MGFLKWSQSKFWGSAVDLSAVAPIFGTFSKVKSIQILGISCRFCQLVPIFAVKKIASKLYTFSHFIVNISNFRYLLIDVWKIWEGTPFLYAGMNSIVLYLGHEICEDLFPFSWQPVTQTHWELLLMNLWGTGLWVLISFELYFLGVFISIWKQIQLTLCDLWWF